MPQDFLTFQDMAQSKIRKNDWLTVKQIAKRHNMSRNMIYWLIKQGRIPSAIKIGNQYLIPQQWYYRKKRKGGKHGPKSKPALALANPDPWYHLVKKTNN